MTKQERNLKISRGIPFIDEWAFYNRLDLKSVTLPDSIRYIGYAAFLGCYFLRDILIPDSVTNISDCAFWGCPLLKIRCHKNSYAAAYAYNHDIECEYIEEK